MQVKMLVMQVKMLVMALLYDFLWPPLPPIIVIMNLATDSAVVASGLFSHCCRLFSLLGLLKMEGHTVLWRPLV